MKRIGTRGFRWLSLAALLFAAAAQGAVVNGLYEASVPVPDQTAPARATALQQALAAVLVKVTGERTAGGVPSLAGLLKDPNRFLQQYHYEQTQDTDGNAPASGVTYFDLTRNGGILTIAGTGLVLHAKFDPDAVDQAVLGAGEPVWGRERPATLVWLAIQDANNRTILSATNNPAVVQAMKAVATQRGVPLIFPAMDAQDQQAIAFTDIWTSNAAVIQQASARYKADAILVGDVYLMSAGQYAVRWQLTFGGSVQAWSGITGDLATIAADGLQTAADNYAKHYAILAGSLGESNVLVQVDGIDSIDAYAQVLAYLNTLTPVKSVRVRQVANGSVSFSIDTRSSVDNLAQAITLGDLLKPEAEFAPVPSAGSTTMPAIDGMSTLRFRYSH